MPSILLPIMTGLFLVFAGILIGYFLWFRDRTEEETLQQNLTSENNRLTGDLSAVRLRSSELEEQRSKQNGKLQILQELCDDLVSGREETHQQRMELEAGLRSSRQLLDESRGALNAEIQARAELEDRLHELKQRHLETVGQIEGNWREKHARIESALVHREGEVQQLSASNERTAERLHHTEARIAELESEIGTQCRLLETATTNANGLEKEYVSLESTLRSHIELLNESLGKAAAALSAKELAEESLSDLRGQFETQQKRLKEYENTAAQAEQTHQKCVSLELSLENAQNRLVEITRERDSAMSAEKESLTVVAGLRKQIENQEMTISSLREKRDELQESFSTTEQNNGRLEQLLDQRSTEFNENRHQWNRKENELTDRVAHLEKSLDQAEEDLAKTEKDLSQTEERLIEYEHRFNEFNAASDEYKSRMKHLVQQRDIAMDETKELNAELNRLRAHSQANEKTIRNLRRERGAILLRNRHVQSEYPRIISGVFNSEEPHTPSNVPNSEITRRDPVRGWVYTDTPEVKDDLKLISGVADVLQRRLNDYGIYTYKQIMEWDQTAIDEFSKLLTFKDRIRRDDWVGQAQRLYQRKYRQAA